MKKLDIFYFVIVLLFVGGCDAKEEPIPAYIHIKPFEVNTNPGSQGTSESQLKDVWLFPELEGYLGTYELPATIPLLLEGEQKIFLGPGIRTNGIDATPDEYVALRRSEITVELILFSLLLLMEQM